MVDSPNNRRPPAAPDLRGITIDRVADDWLCAGTGTIPGQPVNATCPVPVPIADNEISRRVPRTNERRPDPRYTTNSIIANDAESWYHGLQAEWNKAFSSGLWFNATYTWSKAIDNTSEATSVGAGDTNALGPDKEFARGLSRFNTPHRFTFNGTWRLPVFRGRKDWLGDVLGGWQISPVYRFASGTPFTVTDSRGVDLNFDGFSETRPVLLEDIEGRSIDDPWNSTKQLPASAFRQPVFGDTIDMLTHRNAFRVDDTERLDIALSKNFALPYGMTFVLRLDTFNVMNFEQWGFPVTDFTSRTSARSRPWRGCISRGRSSSACGSSTDPIHVQ